MDEAGYCYTSQSGISWSRSTINPNASSSYSFVNFCNGRFLASNKGQNLSSTDGLSWSIMVKDITNLLGRVIYKAPYYLGLSGSKLFTSTNGTNWIQRSLGASTNTTLTGIAIGNSNITVVGYNYLGGSFTPLAFVSGSFVDLSLPPVAFPPQLNLSGWPGRSYRIEFLNDLHAGSNNWQTLTTLTITNNPTLWTDTAATNSQRYYRAVLLP
jgi:hypothetical protein